jgi:hypothetical protein
MNAKLEFDVTISQHESGAFLAACAEFPHKVGIGDTPEDATADLRAFVITPVPPFPTVPTAAPNPWAALAEAFRGTPLLAEWRQEILDRRAAEREREAS